MIFHIKMNTSKPRHRADCANISLTECLRIFVVVVKTLGDMRVPGRGAVRDVATSSSSTTGAMPPPAALQAVVDAQALPWVPQDLSDLSCGSRPDSLKNKFNALTD